MTEPQGTRGVLRTQAVGAGEQIERLGGAALLESDDAREMDRVEIIGSRRAHAAIDRLGLRQATGAVMHDRFL